MFSFEHSVRYSLLSTAVGLRSFQCVLFILVVGYKEGSGGYLYGRSTLQIDHSSMFPCGHSCCV